MFLVNKDFLLLSPTCLNQLNIISLAACFSSDYKALLARMALYVKFLSQCKDKTDTMPLGLKEHPFVENNQTFTNEIKGRLYGKNGENKDVAVRNQDIDNRLTWWLVANRYTNMLTIFEHYNLKVFDLTTNNKKFLFQGLSEQKKCMKNIEQSDSVFSSLKEHSVDKITNLLELSKEMDVKDVTSFNKGVFTQRLCPIFTKSLIEEFNEIKKIDSNEQLKLGLENNLISKNHDYFASGKVKAFLENSKKHNLKRLEKIELVSIFIQDKQSLRRTISNTLLFADCAATVVGKDNLQAGCKVKAEIEYTFLKGLADYTKKCANYLRKLSNQQKNEQAKNINKLVDSALTSLTTNIVSCLTDPKIKPDIILENQMYTELYETIKLMDKSTKDILLNFHNDVHKKSTVALFEQFEQSSYLQEWRKININIIKYGSIYGPNDKPTINTQTVDSQEQSVQQPKNTQVQNNTQEYPSQVNKRRGRGR